MIINASICLTDVPKERIWTGKNGKKYLFVDVLENKEPDKYGNHFSLAIQQTKEEREAKKRVYIGNGKKIEFKGTNPSANKQSVPTNGKDENGNDKLPF